MRFQNGFAFFELREALTDPNGNCEDLVIQKIGDRPGTGSHTPVGTKIYGSRIEIDNLGLKFFSGDNKLVFETPLDLDRPEWSVNISLQ
jgi:hypothetical protein